MKKVLLVFFLVPLLFIGCTKKGEEVSDKNGETFLKVTVLEDGVPLRYHPREESACSDEKLNKGDVVYVAGVDQNVSALDGKKGYWVQVFTEKEYLIYPYWVFSTKIEAGKNLLPNTISFESESISENGKISIAIKGKGNKVSKHDVYVRPVADFYSFTWGPWDDGFNYSDPIGTFIFYPSDKSIARFSSVGDVYCVTGWSEPSPDMKYILSDSGTATCGRVVEVYDAETEECIFGANYYMEVEYSDGKIVWTEPEVHYVYGKNLDAEIADFVANTPVPDDLKNYPANLVVRKFYEHNLVTGEDKFIGYRYAFEE